jgi:Carboxypeptidase regulatory-like domain/TonB dependent receptor
MFTRGLQRGFQAKFFAPIFVFATFLLGGMTAARAQTYRGSLQGTVQDGSGAGVPSARIILRGAEFSFERAAASDSSGTFRMDDIPPGTYRLLVQAAGFAEATSDVRVAVSSVREVTVALKPRSLQQSVTVAAQASSITTQQLDVSSAIHQGVVTARDLQDIPLAARSFANIAYLTPGTEPVEPSDPTKARITAVSTGGSSGLNNDLSVDGADNSDDYIGGFLQNFSPDAIQEFAFRTAQEDADTGRTTAGSVVITTRRGTDEWHGDFAFYERAAALDARYPIENPAPNPKQPFSRQNYIGALGGPIVASKLWFFSSFEYIHERASIAYSPESTSQFNALASLAAQGLIPGVSSINVPGIVPIPFHDTLGTFRLDWQQSANSQWFLRAAVDNYLTENDLVQQGTLPTTGATAHSNYLNLAIGEQYEFSPNWVGSFLLGASGLHHTEAANQHLGFSLQFPFSSTFETISGLDTFGDNSFATPVTAFPVLRNQEKYQLRYDVSHSSGKHSPRFGINFIHEPVLSGALSSTAENITTFAQDPSFYAANPQQFAADLNCSGQGGLAITPGTVCSSIPASDGSFSQNVQRLGFYAEDSWRITPRLTVNYGLRYDTTFGLFEASGRSQLDNPSYLTLQALGISLINGAPHDYRKAFAPRLGLAFAPGGSDKTVLRAGIGLYYNDLAQNGWVSAFQAVNAPPGACVDPLNPPDATNSGCVPAGSPGALIDPNYHTPYALHVTGGAQHSFNANWSLSADYTHEEGMHGYRRYQYTPGFTIDANAPSLALFRSDNRSSYNALMLHLQGNVSHRFNLVANYTLSSAKTWGCVLGELFDYVNGVCNPKNPFGPGDYGPSGEDVTHRGVIVGTFFAPGGVQLSTLFQAESGRPITLTTPVDVNGFGDTLDDRAVVNGMQTSLDEFRGTPYIQMDLRVARPIQRERWTLTPFIEFFNLFNRNNPGANYVTNIAALPVPVNSLTNITALCPTPACAVPVTSPKQLLVPAGALGDFFGPGTTVGIPFAAQIGARFTF